MPSFTARTDRSLVRAEARSTRYVLLQATAPKRRTRRAPKRPPVNVAFVLDRSGSMAGTKLALAKYAVERALTGLAPKDRFAVVTYDDHVETVVGSCLATPTNKTKALLRLQDVDARGSTDLHGGWTAGADGIKAHITPDGVNRCLLLTDGLANVGLTDPPALAAFAADLRASGIGTSTFGVGADFNEVLLTAIADAGGGHFYFVERPEQIPDYMTSELGELLDTVAREVTVEVKHAPELEIEPLSPVAAAMGVPGIQRLLIGDLVVGQQVEVVLRVRFPDMPEGAHTTAFFTIGDRDGVLKADGCTLAWEHATHAANDDQPRDRDVDRIVARIHAARARTEAVRLNRLGEFSGARRALRGVARRIADYAGSDTALQELSASLVAEEAAFSARMSELDRKRAYYRSSNMQRSRDPDGQARR
ncbi:MAG: VWA domain-containing protein [Chloroflexi bacterium]|nr:VWA domain-containing protein [Chloroflexota bacterium]